MKKIILGISGALSASVVPAYILTLKAKYLDVTIEVIQTSNSQYFLSPGAIRHYPKVNVYTCFDKHKDQAKSHMTLIEDADVFIICPSSANFIGKAANGIADDLLSLCFLAASCDKIIMPAMNYQMFDSKPVKRNLEQLANDGCHILNPRKGLSVQSGEIGDGALEEPSKLIELIELIKKKKVQ